MPDDQTEKEPPADYSVWGQPDEDPSPVVMGVLTVIGAILVGALFL